MAWQVIITEPYLIDNGYLVVRYVITDNISQKIAYEYRSLDFSLLALKTDINSKLNLPSKQVAVDPSIVPGVFDPTIAPNPSTIARQTYANNLNLYRHWQAAIQVGVVTATNPTYVSLVATLNSTFDPTYIDLF